MGLLSLPQADAGDLRQPDMPQPERSGNKPGCRRGGNALSVTGTKLAIGKTYYIQILAQNALQQRQNKFHWRRSIERGLIKEI